jgi:hypothetical protein
MVVPSIGQAMASSTTSSVSVAIERSGTVHIVPITWHKVKKNTRAQDCVVTRRIKKPIKFMQNLLNFDGSLYQLKRVRKVCSTHPQQATPQT